MGRDTGRERSCDASGSGTLSTGLKLATDMPYACMGSRLIETTRDSAFLFFSGVARGGARGAVAPGAELRGALKSWGKNFLGYF